MEREITRLVWQEEGEELYLIYADGDPERLTGSLEVASSFAADIGLVLEQDVHGTVQWGRRETDEPVGVAEPQS